MELRARPRQRRRRRRHELFDLLRLRGSPEEEAIRGRDVDQQGTDGVEGRERQRPEEGDLVVQTRGRNLSSPDGRRCGLHRVIGSHDIDIQRGEAQARDGERVAPLRGLLSGKRRRRGHTDDEHVEEVRDEHIEGKVVQEVRVKVVQGAERARDQRIRPKAEIHLPSRQRGQLGPQQVISLREEVLPPVPRQTGKYDIRRRVDARPRLREDVGARRVRVEG